MRLNILTILTALLVSAGLALGPAAAQGITADKAKEIAAGKGMVTVTEIELDDGKWEMEGRTEEGREIEVDIDAATGNVVKYELD
jgi:uncharacterized membrane protein YkoI